MRNMARAEALQKVGYMPYMGPDVAGLTSPQQQAMQANIDAASAFGLVDPGMSATDGMPQTSQFGGISGYSSYPMYQEAVDNYEATSPGQARQYNNLFVNPQSGLGGTTGTGMMGAGINSGGQNNSGAGSHTGDPGDVGQFTAFDPTQYSISDANPYGVSFTAQAPDMTGYITADQLDQRLMAMQPTAPQDMSGYTTTEQLNNALSGLPTYQPQDLSGYARTTDLYDDSQLRQDINSRFSNVNAFDPSNLQAQITANQQGLANLPAAQTPDLSGYATTNDLTNAISGIPSYQAPDLSGYATTEQLNNRFEAFDPMSSMPDLSGYATNEQLNTAIAGVPQFDPSSIDLSGYATSQDLNSAISGLPTYQAPDLSNYAQMSDLYNDTQLRQDMNTRFSNLPTYQAPDLSNYATNDALSTALQGINQYDDTQLRQDINNRFSNLPTYQAPDLSGYATTESVNNQFNNLSQFDPSGLQGQINTNQQAISNLPSYQAPDLSGYATKDQLIGLLSDIGTSPTGVNPSLYSDPNLGQNNATVTPVKATTKKKVSTKKGAR